MASKILRATGADNDIFAHPVEQLWPVNDLFEVPVDLERHPLGSSPLLGREEEFDLLSRRWEQAKSGEGRVGKKQPSEIDRAFVGWGKNLTRLSPSVCRCATLSALHELKDESDTGGPLDRGIDGQQHYHRHVDSFHLSQRPAEQQQARSSGPASDYTECDLRSRPCEGDHCGGDDGNYDKDRCDDADERNHARAGGAHCRAVCKSLEKAE
jgi:hypothetical protein